MPVTNPNSSSSGITIGVTPITGGTQGSVLFIGAASVIAEDNANFFWDDTNNRLGIGTASPSASLDIVSTATTTNALSVTASSLTTGKIGYFYSNSADTGTRTLLQVVNDNTLATGAIAFGIQQDSTATSLFIDHNGATGVALDIDGEQTTADIINVSAAVLTQGIAIDIPDLDLLSTGKGLNIASGSENITTGELVTIALTSSGSGMEEKTGNLVSINGSRTSTRTAGFTSDDYNLLSLVRTNQQNGLGGTFTVTGAVLYVQNAPTPTAGTLTDTVIGLEIQMDNSGTGNAVFINADGTGTSSQISLNIDSESTTADIINASGALLTTGIGLDLPDLNALTTGKGININSGSEAITSGELLTILLTSSGSANSNKTGNLVSINSSRTDTRTTGTTADNYDLVEMIRTTVQNGAGGTTTAAGAVLRVQNVATQTAGTLTDTVKGIELIMDADGSGNALDIDSNNTTAQAININHSGTSGDCINIVADSIANGNVIDIQSMAGLTTGKGINVSCNSTVLTSGELANFTVNTGGDSHSDKSGNVISVLSQRSDTRTSGTTADDYDVLSVTRTTIQNGVGGTTTATGSVLKIQNNATPTAGTLTDTVIGLELVMDADGSGNCIFIDSNGTATKSQIALNIDSESQTADVVAIDGTQLTTGDALQISVDTDNLSTGMAIRVRGTATGTTNVFTIDGVGNTVTEGTASVKSGGAADYAITGGIMFVSTSATGNVGAGEDNLLTYAVPASTLNTNGDSIWFEASGTFAASINNKELRVRFGTATTNLIFDSGSLAITAATDWVISGRIIRTGAATQKAYANLSTSSATLSAYADFTSALDQTLSNSITLRITGEATDNNDIVCESLTIGWDPNNT